MLIDMGEVKTKRVTESGGCCPEPKCRSAKPATTYLSGKGVGWWCDPLSNPVVPHRKDARNLGDGKDEPGLATDRHGQGCRLLRMVVTTRRTPRVWARHRRRLRTGVNPRRVWARVLPERCDGRYGLDRGYGVLKSETRQWWLWSHGLWRGKTTARVFLGDNDVWLT